MSGFHKFLHGPLIECTLPLMTTSISARARKKSLVELIFMDIPRGLVPYLPSPLDQQEESRCGGTKPTDQSSRAQ